MTTTKATKKKTGPAQSTMFPAEGRQVVPVPLDHIQVDPRQPRASDPGKEANVDLIAPTLDIVLGVAHPIQPISIRKTPPWAENQAIPWMIFEGECRYLGAAKRSATAIDAVEIVMPEELVFESQMRTFARDGLGPAAQLDAIRRFDSEHPDVNAANAAVRLGMKSETVRSLRKVNGLPAEVRGNFMCGNHTLEVCDWISKIDGATPEEKTSRQEVASRAVLKMDPRKAREHILKTYLLRLKDAPFDREDASLNPEAGVCSACPHRTGAQASLFGSTDAADDCCTKKSCWDQKVTVTAERNPPPEDKQDESNGNKAKGKKELGKTTQQDVLIAAALAAGCEPEELDAKFSTTKREEIDLSLERLAAHGNPKAGPALEDRKAKGCDLGGYSSRSAHATAGAALDAVREVVGRLRSADKGLFLDHLREILDREDAVRVAMASASVTCEPSGPPPPPPPAHDEGPPSIDEDPEDDFGAEPDPKEDVWQT